MRTDNRPFARSNGCRPAWFTLLVPLLGALLIVAPAVQAQTVSMKDVEAPVLREDWNQVVELLKDVSDDPKKSPDPVLRLIKGHACLALNRNNESVRLFLSVVATENLDAYARWAEGFVQRNRSYPMIYYFQGDMKARQKNWQAAIACFTDAIMRTGKHPLILNSRGVAYARNHQPHEARLDFAEATTDQSRQLADAYANIGALAIQKKDGAEGAIRAYATAIRISPDFALALHGRGCVELALKRFGPAAEDFAAANRNAGCLAGLFAENYQRMAKALTGDVADAARATLASRSGTDVRTGLLRTFYLADTWAKQPTVKTITDFADSLVGQPTNFQEQALKHFSQNYANNPVLASYARDQSLQLANSSSINSAEAKFIARLPNSIGGGGATFSFSFGSLKTDNQLKILDAMNTVANNMYNQASTYLQIKSVGDSAWQSANRPGGCLATFAGSIHDAGDWPFCAYYGLYYQ